MDNIKLFERKILSRYYIDYEKFKEIAEDKRISYDKPRYLRRRSVWKLNKILEKEK